MCTFPQVEGSQLVISDTKLCCMKLYFSNIKFRRLLFYKLFGWFLDMRQVKSASNTPRLYAWTIS